MHDVLPSQPIQFVAKPVLSSEEETDLVRRGQSGDKAAAHKLIEHNLGVLWQITTRLAYDRARLSRDDVFQQAVLYAMSLLRTFDPDRGYRFATYVGQAVRMKMWRHIAQNESIIRVPHVPSKNRVKQTRRAETIEKALKARRRMSPIPDCYDPAENEPDAYEEEDLQNLDALREQINSLPARLKQVIELRLSGLTLGQIGKQMGGISKERVRQLEAKAIRLIHEGCNEYVRQN